MLSRSLLSRTALRVARTPGAGNLVFRRLLSDDIRRKLDAAVKEKPLVLFMKGELDQPQCGFSRAVVTILDRLGASDSKIKSYNVLVDPQLRESIKEYSQWPTIPQLYVNGEFIGGSDIVLDMFQNGSLETLLVEHNIIDPVQDDKSSA